MSSRAPVSKTPAYGLLLLLGGCGGSIAAAPDPVPRGQGPFEGCPVELRVLDDEHMWLGERDGACAELGGWLAEGTIDRPCLESLIRAGDSARACVGTWLEGPRRAVVPTVVTRVDSTPSETPCIVTFTLRGSGEVRLADSPAPLGDLAALARGTCPGREPRALVVVDEGTEARLVEAVVEVLHRGGVDEVAVDVARPSVPP